MELKENTSLKKRKYNMVFEDNYYQDGSHKRPIYRIVADDDFVLQTGEVVKKGDRGGLIELEYNLSQEGNCWVKEGLVCGLAKVKDSALVMQDFSSKNELGPLVTDTAVVEGYARIIGGLVTDKSVVRGNCEVRGYLAGKTVLDGNIVVGKDAFVSNAILSGNHKIAKNKRIVGQNAANRLMGKKSVLSKFVKKDKEENTLGKE